VTRPGARGASGQNPEEASVSSRPHWRNGRLVQHFTDEFAPSDEPLDDETLLAEQTV
jgi:hypothetical protein